MFFGSRICVWQTSSITEIEMASLNDILFTNDPIAFTFRSRFGRVRVRFTKRGLAELGYPGDDGASGGEREDVPLIAAFADWVDRFDGADSATRWNLLDLAGSEFRLLVWRRLLEFPYGARLSYGEIAAEIGQPEASRAVGSAVGANPVALVVPCHRVVPKAGGSGNYRWGVERKRALLDAERESGSALGSLLF